MKYNIKERGVTLLEVGVAAGVVVLVLLGLISAVTRALDGAQYARNKALATKYAQETMEWLRGQRDNNWSVFYSRSGTFTLNCDLRNQNTIATCGGATIDDAYDIFVRQVVLTPSGVTPPYNNDSVQVRVTVSWNQGNKPSDVRLESSLTKWR